MAKVKEGKQGNVWIVKGGDNVAKIAREVYGNERMMAEIMRLNGGVKTLRPGMVLRLPNPKKNSDIFISNDWAANMGMATTDQVAQWYDQNPNAGGMTRDWNAAGGGWKNSIAGGGQGLNPSMSNGSVVPSVASNAWGNNLDALGAMQTSAPAASTSSNPYGSNADAIAAMRANAGRSTNANRPVSTASRNSADFAKTGNTAYDGKVDDVMSRMAGTDSSPRLTSRYIRNSIVNLNLPMQSGSVPTTFAHTGNTNWQNYKNPTNDVIKEPDFAYRNWRSLNRRRDTPPVVVPSPTPSSTSPDLSSPAPTPYWQLATRNPYSVNNTQIDPNTYVPGGFFQNSPQKQTKQPGNPTVLPGQPIPLSSAAQGAVQAAAQAAAQVQVVDPYTAFGIANKNFVIKPTTVNQNPETLARIAPLVQQAMSSYAYSVQAPPGKGTFTLDQAKVLEQAGVIYPGSQNYDEVMQYLNQNNQIAPTTTPTTTNTNGSWDVWNLGGTQMPTWMESQFKHGGGGLSDYSGYIRNSYGPSLGLKNWRGI